MTIITKVPTTCPIKVGLLTRCGLPVAVTFHLGSEIVVVRCETHADGFHLALRSLLRPTQWSEEHVLTIPISSDGLAS